jgi:hypothetical protein
LQRQPCCVCSASSAAATAGSSAQRSPVHPSAQVHVKPHSKPRAAGKSVAAAQAPPLRHGALAHPSGSAGGASLRAARRSAAPGRRAPVGVRVCWGRGGTVPGAAAGDPAAPRSGRGTTTARCTARRRLVPHHCDIHYGVVRIFMKYLHGASESALGLNFTTPLRPAGRPLLRAWDAHARCTLC